MMESESCDVRSVLRGHFSFSPEGEGASVEEDVSHDILLVDNGFAYTKSPSVEAYSFLFGVKWDLVPGCGVVFGVVRADCFLVKADAISLQAPREAKEQRE